MERICNRCGCSSFHYNRSRMRMECDSCGTPVYDAQQDQQLMQFDRTYFQAMSHLAAGNWNQTIGILKPLLTQHPTEKKLYIAILRAATKDYQDISMDNTADRSSASDAWDKLIRLNGETGEMIRYSRQRYEKHREELEMQKNKILAWLFAAAICSGIAGFLIGMSYYFGAVVCTGGLIGCLYKFVSYRPIKVIKQLTSAVPDYRHNPFI